MNYKELVEKLEANLSRVAEIDDMAEITEELKEEQETLISEQSDLQARIERKRQQIEAGEFLETAKNNTPVEKRKVPPMQVTPEIPSENQSLAEKIPATAKRYAPIVNSFTGNDADLKAYRFGQYFMATAGVGKSIDYCNQFGINMVHNEGTNSAGGYLVPEEFSTDLIRLVLDYGAFRRNASIVPMMSDVKNTPRRTGGITAYWVGESEAGTESDMTWDNIKLTAKKLKAITRASNELSDDAAIAIGDQIFNEIALAFAYAEDSAGFNGDGTSTYGGIMGVVESLDTAAGSPTTASAGGIVIADGNNYSEITLPNLNTVIATCPTYAKRNAKWYASPYFYNAVMVKLLTAAGGNTVNDIANGGVQRFLGYPVELVEVLPTSEANSQICCLFGDLRQAAKLGDRMMRTISTSEHATVDGENVWEKDQLAIKGVERIDINVHDVGTSSAAGPIVGLQTLNA